jgi:flagellar assembly protein FliH
MMPAATKFSFDTTFDLAEPVDARKAEQEAPPPEPTFSAEELAAARAEGFDAGQQSAFEASNASLESAVSQALSDIAGQLAALGPACQSGLDQCRREAIGIAHAIGRKMVETSARDTALQAIEDIVGTMLTRVIDEPRVVIRVHNDILDTLQQRMASVTASSGFPGSVILLSEPDMEIADCRIEWADGGGDFSIDAVLAEIDTMIGRYRAGIGVGGPLSDSADIVPDSTEIAADLPQSPDIPETTDNNIEEQING